MLKHGQTLPNQMTYSPHDQSLTGGFARSSQFKNVGRRPSPSNAINLSTLPSVEKGFSPTATRATLTRRHEGALPPIP